MWSLLVLWRLVAPASLSWELVTRSWEGWDLTKTRSESNVP